MNKTIFTCLTGALFFSLGYCYAVYNTRDAVMKWSGMGEFKTARHEELARMNAGPCPGRPCHPAGEHMDLGAADPAGVRDKSQHGAALTGSIPSVHFIP